MSTSPVYLYDAAHQPVGSVGVLVMLVDQGYGSYGGTFDAAVFSPWPGPLKEGAPFVVRTQARNGRTRWRTPFEVRHFRAMGQRPSTNVAFVVLEGAASGSTVQGGGGLRHSIGIDTHGIREELAQFSPTFSPLRAATDASAELAAMKAPTSAPPQAVVPGYTRTSGTAVVVNRGLCRLLHWD